MVVGQWVGGTKNAGQWRGLEAAPNNREEEQTEQRKGEFWGAFGRRWHDWCFTTEHDVDGTAGQWWQPRRCSRNGQRVTPCAKRTEVKQGRPKEEEEERRRKSEAVHGDGHGSAWAAFIIEFLLSIHLPLPNILT